MAAQDAWSVCRVLQLPDLLGQRRHRAGGGAGREGGAVGGAARGAAAASRAGAGW